MWWFFHQICNIIFSFHFYFSHLCKNIHQKKSLLPILWSMAHLKTFYVMAGGHFVLWNKFLFLGVKTINNDFLFTLVRGKTWLGKFGIYQMGKWVISKFHFICEIYPHIGKHTHMLGLHITTYSQWRSIDGKKWIDFVKIKFHSNENIEWHWIQLELNWIELNWR